VSVFWLDDDKYYPGTIKSATDDGRFDVHYDDGDKECLGKFSSTVQANTSSVPSELEVSSTEPTVLSSILEHFGNKSFLKHQAQGFEQFPLINAYQREEGTFLKTARIIPKDKSTSGANIIGSHTLYKVKHNDDGSLKLKARIAPHGNEDDIKHMLNKDCTICPPTGLRIVE